MLCSLGQNPMSLRLWMELNSPENISKLSLKDFRSIVFVKFENWDTNLWLIEKLNCLPTYKRSNLRTGNMKSFVNLMSTLLLNDCRILFYVFALSFSSISCFALRRLTANLIAKRSLKRLCFDVDSRIRKTSCSERVEPFRLKLFKDSMKSAINFSSN